ncbi:alpha/beta fold hydrolase [Shewanella sp. Isolate7]|uniref:alpha/beta fold hydrolase n=1 Tax=Shewanella sp. Isolate7 TaxID=2908528 RepID=UPI001EFDA12B|nr:alpha/beta fold hydrolase [Shewanella sp. Isolate7]MCG9722454.1 alpha/beta fold hydrolase [Shewanella sp. Isolate7]
MSFTQKLDARLKQAELPASQCLFSGAVDDSGLGCDTIVVLAHGAGANMEHGFMAQMAERLGSEKSDEHDGEQAIGVLRFNFPYMRSNAIDGKRRPPDRAPKLIKDFSLLIQTVREVYQPKRLIVMGKSMGGRMAAMLGAEQAIDGVICLGYPFVPPKGGEPRLEPIAECRSPLLVIQGERDKFGAKGQVESWLAPFNAKLEWLTDGDHSFLPRKSSGTTQSANLDRAVSQSIQFIRGLDA